MWIQPFEACLFGLALYLVGQLVRRQRTPLPPGPSGWPLIGNLFDVPKHASYKALGAMSRKHGPIITLKIIGMQYIIINNPKVAKDLLEKKSAITSNRPHLTMGCDLVGWRSCTALLQYGDTYRKHRKFFQKYIGTKSGIETSYPAAVAETKQLLRNVVKNPDNLRAHCNRMAGGMILKMSHGYTVKEVDDPFVEMANKVIHNFSVILQPGQFLVDMFPILRYLPEWFPGTGFHKYAKHWRKLLKDAVEVPHKFVVDHLARGDAEPSFVSQALQEGLTHEEQESMKWASFSIYIGGSDTTSSTVSAFFLAMTMYPEVLKKAQAEVDAVIGHDRLPTCDDRDALPYTNAICKELLRWHTVAAFTIHVSTQDTIYEGYLIPKGTFLLPNIWFMLSDPETYPNPDVFDPERFLGENQQLDPREMCFGWGRRSCPGARLAQSTLFACISMAVATLNVSRCVENGVECIPRYEAIEGTARYVKPFKFKATLRSKEAEDLLQA